MLTVETVQNKLTNAFKAVGPLQYQPVEKPTGELPDAPPVLKDVAAPPVPGQSIWLKHDEWKFIARGRDGIVFVVTMRDSGYVKFEYILPGASKVTELLKTSPAQSIPALVRAITRKAAA